MNDEPTRNREEELLDRADHERTERKDREMEELWAHRILTPETDAIARPYHPEDKMLKKAKDLERRLTVARKALRKASDMIYGKGQAGLQEVLCDALIQTAPKP